MLDEETSIKAKYADKQIIEESCSLRDDLLLSSMLQAVLISVFVLFGLFALALVCFCRKYNDLKAKYS